LNTVQGKSYKNIIAKHMTSAQIAEAQKLSGEFWEKYVVPFQEKGRPPKN